MALTISNVTTATRTTAGSSLAFSSVSANPGDWLVVMVAADNSGTSGVSPMTAGGISVSSGAVSWASRILANRTAGAANDGASLGVWTGAVLSTLSSVTVTVTFSPNVTRAAGAIYKVVPAAGNHVAYDTVGTATSGSATSLAHTTQSVTSGYTVICSCAIEHTAVPTGDSDTTNGTWSTIYGVASSSGTASSSMSIGNQWKTVSATATQTWNLTWGTLTRDRVANSLTIFERADPSYFWGMNGVRVS